MAGITHEQAEARLATYLEAEAKVLSGQSYEIDGRALKRANLAEIQAGINIWNQRVKDLSAKASGRSRSANVSPGW
ncbi:DUF6148 family protein [Nitrosomonas communis]|uniref:DUF6148 family protein n=1 Tax=Nitrosomonas communis TaxID=44574 RepID=UPI003D27BF4B